MASLRLEHALIAASLGCAAAGAWSPGADPLRARLLVRDVSAQDPTGNYALQTLEAVRRLRPWHPGYADLRAAVEPVQAARRRAVTRW